MKTAPNESYFKRTAQRYLKIYSSEFRAFVWIAFIFFTGYALSTDVGFAADSLFLNRSDPDHLPAVLPKMFLIVALLTLLCQTVIDRLFETLPLKWVVGGLTFVYAALLASWWFLSNSWSSPASSYSLLYVAHFVSQFLFIVYLWNTAGELFDGRQARRLFPLLVVGQTLGVTLGSFVAKVTTSRVAVDNLPIWCSIGLFGLAFFAVLMAPPSVQHRRKQKERPDPQAKDASLDAGRILKKNSLLMYLTIGAFVANATLTILFIEYKLILAESFETAKEIVEFLAPIEFMRAWTALALTLVAVPLFRYLGVANAALIQPLNVTIALSVMAIWVGPNAAAYAYVTVMAGFRTLYTSAEGVLLGSVSSGIRAWSHQFIRGPVSRLGVICASILMVIVAYWLQSDSTLIDYFCRGRIEELLYENLGVELCAKIHNLLPLLLGASLSGYWMVQTLRLKRSYRTVLKQAVLVDLKDEIIPPSRAHGDGTEFDSSDSTHDEGEQDEIPSGIDPPANEEDWLDLLKAPRRQARRIAAGHFGETRDVRAVGKLLPLLADPDFRVSIAAIEALAKYGSEILPLLEAVMLRSNSRMQLKIVEVLRRAGLSKFDVELFVAHQSIKIYEDLLAEQVLKDIGQTPSVAMLRQTLREHIEQRKELSCLGLWVYSHDMPLMYEALKSDTASVAVEFIEETVPADIARYVIPIIEPTPIDHKIAAGRRLFPLIKRPDVRRILLELTYSRDPLIRMLSLCVIGDLGLNGGFLTAVENCLGAEDPYVREAASITAARMRGEVQGMPALINTIESLKRFVLFAGLGMQELRAIATVARREAIEPGQVIISEQEENRFIYLLISGDIRVFKNYGTSEQREERPLKAGSFLGELSLFTGRLPAATCVADTPLDILLLPHAQFKHIMGLYPQIGINLCRFFSTRLSEGQY